VKFVKVSQVGSTEIKDIF